jgi:hypothetical protein
MWAAAVVAELKTKLQNRLQMGKFVLLYVIAWIALGSSGVRSQATDVVGSIGHYRFPIDASGNQLFLPFEASLPIDRPGKFSKLVIYVHGSARGVKLSASMQALLSAPNKSATLLLMPQFLKDRDRAPHKLPDNVPTWANKWEWGDLSSPAAGQRISAFAVVDQIITELLATTPSISSVTIVGNSAGGQFAQRYAALSPVEDIINAGTRYVSFKYLVSNPSSYLYFNDKRELAPGVTAVPTTTAIENCPKFNMYGYGLENLNSYAKSSTIAEIQDRFMKRTIVYFIGDDDNYDNGSLDTSCAAEMQGTQRFERARKYWHHLINRFGSQAMMRQVMVCIPGGVHRASSVWDTSCGRFYLNGGSSCKPVPCPEN